MIQTLFKKNGKPACFWITENQKNILDIKDSEILQALLTCYHVSSWVSVRLHGVMLRTILAIGLRPLESPRLPGKPPTIFPDEDMNYPSGDRNFWKSLHIIRQSRGLIW